MHSSTLIIKTTDEAKKVWDQFRAQYFSEEIKETKEEYKIPSDAPLLKIQKKIAARRIGKKWQEVRASNKLVTVRVGKKHSPFFKYFLNNDKNDKPIEKSLNKIKLDRLLAALAKGDWMNDIFIDSHVSNLAITLFASAKISFQQCSSMLEFLQIKSESPIHTLPLLDAKGELSERGLHFFMPTINLPAHYKTFINSSLVSFVKLVSTLPASEQVFHTRGSGHLKKYDLKPITLGEVLINTGAIYLTPSKGHLIYLTAGVRDALGIAKNGIDQYVRLIPRIDAQTMEDIDYGVRHQFRPGVILFPKIKPIRMVHQSDVSLSEATLHDYHHCLVATATPKEIRKALLNLIDVVREYTHIPWSYETWRWLDNDYRYFLHTCWNRYDTIPAVTQAFCKLLDSRTQYKSFEGGHLTLHLPSLDYEFLMTTGAIVFIDMVKNPQKWLALKIDPEQLIGSAKTYYQAIKNNFSLLEDKENWLTVLNCMMLFALDAEVLPLTIKLLNKHSAELNIKFDKVSKADTKKICLPKNAIYLSYNGRALELPLHIKRIMTELYERFREDYLLYKKPMITYGFNEKETADYLSYIAKGIRESKARYLVKPNFSAWFGKNLTRNILLGMSVVGLPAAYGYSKYSAAVKEKSHLQKFSLLRSAESKSVSAEEKESAVPTSRSLTAGRR